VASQFPCEILKCTLLGIGPPEHGRVAPAIPRRVALQQSPLPFRRMCSACYEEVSTVQQFSANCNLWVNWLSQPWGPPQSYTLCLDLSVIPGFDSRPPKVIPLPAQESGVENGPKTLKTKRKLR